MRRTTALLLAAIAIVAIVAWGFRPEAVAIGWHVRHGLHANGAGLRIRVPLLFTAIEGDQSLVLISPMGRFRARFVEKQGSVLFISTRRPDPPYENETTEQVWARLSQSLERQGARVTATRNITIAGRTARCIQYEAGGMIVGVDVWCLPEGGGRLIDYLGPRSRVQELYSILESAQTR